MALLERISTLLRANLNDLLSKAEDPEKLANQLILDMENQLMQVKTQVAVAIAEEHLLRKKRTEHETAFAQWRRKAELAVAKQQDDLARLALERVLSHQKIAEGLAQQHADQAADTEGLRAAYHRLQQKLTETRARVERLSGKLRRSRMAQKAAGQAPVNVERSKTGLARLAARVEEAGLRQHAARTLLSMETADTLDERFASIEQRDQIDALLLELKDRQPRLP